MRRRYVLGWLIAACAGWLAADMGRADGWRASETLLPPETKAWLSVPNLPELLDSWNRTELSRLFTEGGMREFAEDLQRQILEKWSRTHQRLGLQLADFEGLATGELALAVVQTEQGAALAALADVRGNEASAAEALAEVSRALIEKKAQKQEMQIEGIVLTVFQVPAKRRGDLPTQVVYFLHGGLLVASDHLPLAEQLAARCGGGQGDSLAQQPAFTAVLNRCRETAGELAPQVRWWVDPFGLARAMRASERPPREHNPDWLAILANQKFDAILGVGGHVNFAHGKYGILHRTVVYAPQPYQLAMRMLAFPNGHEFAPPPWVPRNVATYATFQWDMKQAFDCFGSLFDEVYGEPGTWEDTLREIAEDPTGPRINIRRDLIAHLGTRAMVMRDYKLPITPQSERRLFAAEVRDTDALRASIDKMMESDPSAHRRQIAGYDVWEVIAEQVGDTELDIENPEIEAALPGDTADDLADEGEDAMSASSGIPNSAVAVAHGCLLVASHVDLLEKVLAEVPATQQLAVDADFLQVTAELEKLGLSAHCARAFARTDEQFRITYELFRTGKMPEADTLLGRLLNTLLGEEKEGELRRPKFDGSKLPDYSVVQRYLGPAGTCVSAEEQGWLIVGFTFSGQSALAGARAAEDTRRK
ncbi:MAG: hypothetical protein K6T86_11340 [Pirellulales bacterium]|nr:hypothetical protein [Pirellulales bacterium]